MAYTLRRMPRYALSLVRSSLVTQQVGCRRRCSTHDSSRSDHASTHDPCSLASPPAARALLWKKAWRGSSSTGGMLRGRATSFECRASTRLVVVLLQGQSKHRKSRMGFDTRFINAICLSIEAVILPFPRFPYHDSQTPPFI